MNMVDENPHISARSAAMEDDPWKAVIRCLEARIFAMEELLEVYEKVVLDQTEKLFREISERRRAEEALIDSEGFLGAIIEGLPIPMFVIDKDHRVIYWNNALERHSGIGAWEVIGSNQHYRAFYREERPCIADLLVDHKEDNIPAWYGAKCRKSQVVEGAYACIDFFPIFGGRGAWLYFTAKVIRGANNAIIGAMEAFVDISDRKLAEDEIRRLNEELTLKMEQLITTQQDLVRKEKLASIGLLAGSVGHELRNPLGVMNNAVYFLQSIIPETNTTAREYLEIIKQEIDNSQKIIHDLLDYSRLKAPESKMLPPRELIMETVEGCKIPDNIELELSLADALPAVMVDPLQMERVFLNLLTNAVQAMPGGGTLRITASTASITGNDERGAGKEEPSGAEINRNPRNSNRVPDAGFVEISIEDTGEGIAPENMDKIFQPLYTTKARGIGLGLSICKSLTETNGGRIEVESQLSKGTTFTVALPVAEPNA